MGRVERYTVSCCRPFNPLFNFLSISIDVSELICCAHIYLSSETVVQDLRGTS